MSWTLYQSKDMVFTYDGVTATGVQEIATNNVGKPRIAKRDSTKSGDAAYAFTADELGAKGSAKSTIRVTTQLSRIDVTDSGLLTKTLGGSGTVLFYPDGNVAGNDTWTATMYLQGRETVAELGAYVTTTYTFEANTAGTWSSAAGA